MYIFPCQTSKLFYTSEEILKKLAVVEVARHFQKFLPYPRTHTLLHETTHVTTATAADDDDEYD